MPTPVTITPDSPLSKAYRWAVERIQADPTLRRTVRTWLLWDGSSKVDNPLPTGQTAVRLTPMFEPPTPEAGHMGHVVYRSPIRLQVEARVSGFNVENSINLASLILAAVWPKHYPETLAMRAAGVSWLEGVMIPAKAGDQPIGVGAVRLVVFTDHVLF